MFALFRLNYHNQYYAAFPDAEQLKQIKKLWLDALRDYPVVAITDKEHEHRGIAAVRAGAQGYICIDDITVEGQEAVFDHAARRHRLQQRMSDTDVSVLSVLTSINDGVIVVDTPDALLVISADAAQDVKQVVSQLKAEKSDLL